MRKFHTLKVDEVILLNGFRGGAKILITLKTEIAVFVPLLAHN